MAMITALFVPGDRPERFSKAASTRADAIIIDLEDAVAPNAKAAAREALGRPGVLPDRANIFVRVNAAGTIWHRDDLETLAGLKLAGIMLPKVEGETVVSEVAAVTGYPVIALLETARGIAAARQIARAAGVARLAFGSIDFCADLGVSHTREALLATRSEIVLASRLADLPAPWDGVTTATDDLRLIEEDARYSYELGFGGKLCVHPRQIALVRRGFSPNADEISWARRILEAADLGAVAIDGKMVDAPVRAKARQILLLACEPRV